MKQIHLEDTDAVNQVRHQLKEKESFLLRVFDRNTKRPVRVLEGLKNSTRIGFFDTIRYGKLIGIVALVEETHAYNWSFAEQLSAVTIEFVSVPMTFPKS